MSVTKTDLWKNHKISNSLFHHPLGPQWHWNKNILSTPTQRLTTVLAYIFVLDPYHAYRNLETNSLHDSNNINQNFSSQPYFDFSVPRNVTTRVGQTAFLNCRVEQLGDKLVSFIIWWESHYELYDIFQFTGALLRLSIDAINTLIPSSQVSWIRKRDLHILR